jgi:hypothetical protein
MRNNDPPLIEELREGEPASPYVGAQEQARLYMAFIAELEALGLTRDEALWLTSQVWRAS